MAFVEKDAGQTPQLLSHVMQLPHGFWTNENASALRHGVPKIAAVLGNASSQRVSLAIVLHF